MDDRRLIKKILKGSVDDYALLVERYQIKLQSTLSFYCNNVQEVEYFLHETFVHAYSKLQKYNPDYPFFPWLKTLAINLLRDEIRSRKTLSEDAKNYLLEEMQNQKQNDEKLEALQRCIAELDAPQQEIMKMRYWAKNGIEDLAESLGRKPSAVKMQILRIREALKRCIKTKLEASHG